MGVGPVNCLPGMMKKFTTYCQPPSGGVLPFRSAHSDHPSFLMGVEALNDFHDWVARVVLPIAFQWIEENYDAVYEQIDPDKRDDVGVVIAAAYQLIQNPAALQTLLGQPKQSRSGAPPDDLTLNPIWAKITKKVRKATREAFEEQRPYLDDTIPSPNEEAE